MPDGAVRPTIGAQTRAGRCKCCGGTGRVMSATGAVRPCSRCHDVEFMRWSDAMRPTALAVEEVARHE